MSGPDRFDYALAFVCFAVFAAALLGLAVCTWRDRRHYRPPRLTRRERRAWARGLRSRAGWPR